jgi:hypothetical protein
VTGGYATVNGLPCQSVRVIVSNVGPWHALLDVAADELLSGAVTIRIGLLTLTGTVTEAYSGTFGTDQRCRVVAGAAGWAQVVQPKGYHNDAGVKARLIAEDAARAVGERIGSFTPAVERVGVDYARERTHAVAALEDAAGPGVAWWVDYTGVTHVGPRPAATADAEGYDVLAYDPRTRVATLGIDDPSMVTIGSLIVRGLDKPRVVRELEIRADAEGLRAIVWLGGADSAPDRLSGLVRAIVARATDGKIFGPWRYRVVRMAAGRAELQPVNASAGLPDISGIEVWPGVASAHAELTPGSHALVQFIEGDRAQPIVTHVAPRGASGWIPSTVTIGGESGPPAARQGDAVEVLLPPAVFNGTMNGSTPLTGVMTFTAVKAVGAITGGSGKVRIAT